MVLKSLLDRCAPVLAGALLLTMIAPAQGADFLEAIDRVMREHPEIRAAERSVEAARANIRVADSAYLPSLALNSDYGHEWIDSPERRLTPGDSSSLPRSKATLTLTQNLFSGGRNAGNVSVAQSSFHIAEIALAYTRQSVLYEAYDAYSSVLRDSWLVELASLNEQTIAKQLNLEDERVERGAGYAVDVLLVKTRLQLARERKVNYAGQFKASQSRYEEAFGSKPELTQMDLVEVDPSSIPATVDEVRDVVVKQNLSLLGAAREIDVAKSRERIADADFLPAVNLEGGLNVENNINATRGVRRDAFVLVRLTWELFSGFRIQAASKAASEQKFVAINKADDVRRAVVEDATRAWEALQTARERAGLLLNASNIALEVSLARQRLREAGQESALNVLDAETEVFNARINQTSAEHDARVAQARLLLAMGLLVPDNLHPQPAPR